ncbi:hypothetical protein [Litoreibacter janthinus]|uniref:Uncharacterized protein n=1 Tax=Litoreibacter janthinus TaxID=670154 RepID=A0A1I6H097_9RHOB|nr:hypothetical protein [Litoreibacter janthinus]SFR47883.1 hypothetical protein SAMN04488002_2249 [Litoreibacter janthinus]
MFLYFEGVNHAETLYDTDDISTIRGSSIQLEDLGPKMKAACAPLNPQLLSFGASKALLYIDAPRTALEQAGQDAVQRAEWQPFSITWGIGDSDAQAIAAARIRQFQSWTFPPPDPAAAAVQDALDQTRPATILDIHGSGEKRMLSPATSARRENGKKNRRNLFTDAQKFAPPQSFEDITADPPPDIPQMVRGKLAVIYADGAGGGKLRKAVGDDLLFSKDIAKHRAALAAAVESWMLARGPYGCRTQNGKTVPRFDTLLWGGDDMTFILPAWLALPFIGFFFEQIENWTFMTKTQGEQHLRHRLSCVIAGQKTPIRQFRTLARNGDSLLKRAVKNTLDDAPQSAFSIDIFESSALPFDGLLAYRRQLYSPTYEPKDDFFLPPDATKLTDFCADVLRADDEGVLSVTQIHGALESLRRGQGDDPSSLTVASSKGDNRTRELVTSYYERVKGSPPPFDAIIAAFSDQPRRFSMLLAQAAQLHPYAVAARKALQ